MNSRDFRNIREAKNILKNIKKAPLPPDGDPTDPNSSPRTIKEQIKSAIREFESMGVSGDENHNKHDMGLRKLYRLLKHLDDPKNY
tara:strand:+ start:1109 stop:1366 length:258 start_codon:yes stop_codon:yes gene_type:complete